MNIEAITNYIQVSDRIASSRQPDDKQLKSIAEAKYQVVINLAMPNSDNAIPEEGNVVTAHKMIYVHIPVPFEAPSHDHLIKFLDIMDVFADQKIWIHCAVNYRVSAFLYQYQRLVHGATQEEAKRAMLPSWEPDDVWQRFMAYTNEELALSRRCT